MKNNTTTKHFLFVVTSIFILVLSSCNNAGYSGNHNVGKENTLDGKVLAVGKVKFGINTHSEGLCLLSSTQPDDHKMRQVIEYLSSIYGEPEEDESDNYWWRIGADDGYLGLLQKCGRYIPKKVERCCLLRTDNNKLPLDSYKTNNL